MQPFEDGDPRASWDICPARHCKQLLDGRIWKCAPLAYLPMQKAKYRLSEKWDTYLGYKPLEPDCSRAELRAFAALEDEAACGMCAAKKRLFELPVPLRIPKARTSPTV
jgi:rubredoxin